MRFVSKRLFARTLTCVLSASVSVAITPRCHPSSDAVPGRTTVRPALTSEGWQVVDGSVAPRPQPRATARVIDVRELRAMIQVRSVARRVLTSAKRDLADRPETLNCRLLVLHVHRLPEMVNTWLYASGRPTYGRATQRRDAICVP
jgi:hypothetical protein